MKGLFVDDGGSGPPVVLHHGLGADLEVWRAQIDHLRHSHRVLAFDMRGHGRSPRASGYYTLPAVAEDLAEVTAPLQKFWLVGHSFAGTVLTVFAGQHPERLLGLVYVDAIGDSSNPPQEIRDYFRREHEGVTPARLQAGFTEMLGPLAKPETKRRVLASVERMDLPAFAALRESMLEMPTPRHFGGPKFAIDAVGPANPRMAYNLPWIRRLTIPGVSHWLMMDDPGAFNAALDEVLA